jgi:hypothetical protein
VSAEPDSFEEDLLQLAQARLAAGVLPLKLAGELRAMLGHDRTCSVCGMPVSSQEIELTVLPAPVAAPDLRFHCRCYIAWHRVCGIV